MRAGKRTWGEVVAVGRRVTGRGGGGGGDTRPNRDAGDAPLRLG
jgi:hypothetical protein